MAGLADPDHQIDLRGSRSILRDEASGSRSVLIAAAICFGMTAVLAWRVPAPPIMARPEVFSSWRRLLAHRQMWIFIGTSALAQAANAAYDACYALHLAALGHAGAFIGLAWGFGTLGEVLLMWRSGYCSRGSHRRCSSPGPSGSR